MKKIGNEFSIFVAPDVLEGNPLAMDIRLQIWNKLSLDWKITDLYTNVNEVSLEGLNKEINTILKGNHKGRIIVNLDL